MDQEWIGIQFNLINDKILKGGQQLNAMGIEVLSDHITIKFSRKELKRFDPKKGSEKLKIALAIIRKYLEHSDYTNIYTYLDAEKLSNSKEYLKETVFQGKPMRVEKLINKQLFLDNFLDKISHQSFISLVRKNPLMKFMDTILQEMVKRDFANQQELTLVLLY